MFQTVEIPVWVVVVLFALPGVAALDRVIGPGVRWFFRRRMERVVAQLNSRLERPLEPFKLMARQDMIVRLNYDPKVMEAVVDHAKAAGVPGAGSAISVAKRVFTSGDLRASVKAVLSLRTVSAGVPAGATRLCQATASKSLVPAWPDSAMVGTSATAGGRLAEVTAIGYINPIIVTIGAALFLAEDVRLRRWIAVIVGFIGAMIWTPCGRFMFTAPWFVMRSP